MVAFILIKTEKDLGTHILKKMRTMEEFDEVHPLFGEYDLIAKITARDFKQTSSIVLTKIRTINGVIETETLPGLTL
ncbi:MAG: Lrp/AsnC ligand binding domain-containing protein [Thermoplasmatota archaeon]